MDYVVQSNESSVILRSLANAEVHDLSYEIAPSYPILSKMYKQIQPNNPISAAPGGQQVIFNIPKAQLLRDMYVQTVYTYAANVANDYNTMPGLTMFSEIQIRSNNKIIMTLSDSYLIARTQQMRAEASADIYANACALSTINTAGAIGESDQLTRVTYTPLFASFFESPELSMDLNFYEQIQLSLTYNTTSRFMGYSSGANPLAITSVNSTLWLWTYRLDDKSYDILRSRNQNPSRPLNMLAYNTFRESLTLTSPTTTSIRLNVNYPCFTTYFTIRNNGAFSQTANGAGDIITPDNYSYEIDSFSLLISGQYLLQNVPTVIGRWESTLNGGSGGYISTASGISVTGGPYVYPTQVVKLSNRYFAIHWGLEPHNRISNSGAVSWSQINYPQIVVNYPTPTNYAGLELDVVHEYYNILTLDASNGSVQVTVNV